MPDVSLMIQSGYTPRKEWLERHFRVELEEKKEGGGAEEEATTFDPEQDQDVFGSIFGGEGGQPPPGQEQAAAQDLNAAANVMDEPAGATPEESQSDADSDTEMSDQEVLRLLGLSDDEPEKPFGNQSISEDEAVEMDK